MTCERLAHDLDPYVDRELDRDHEAAVRQHLVMCAACRRRVTARQAIGTAVRSAPYHVAPDRLRTRLLTRRRHPYSRWIAAASVAAALLLVSSGAIVSRMRTPPADAIASSDERMIETVVDGHIRSLLADHLVDVGSSDQHTVKPWFLGKLDFAPSVTDLAAVGYPLVGGRLEYLSGRAVAALVYQRRNHTINLFMWPTEGTRASEVSRSIRGFHVRTWIRDRMAYWAVSDLNETELDTFVRALQEP